eukprot:CAMPEP_0183487962 /NCGR_PEP_ID=MMETSP0370-20130417/180703_1 /TAXON_ID=268820 /ORGANISM="Peridinium aciculiferum, Strain PAER-2" /LENGTH=360 /DNA_ID=CAMNT_0025681291 /DNA_START=80 /DNA_END=1161 /DNA_ORIENTATION=-
MFACCVEDSAETVVMMVDAAQLDEFARQVSVDSKASIGSEKKVRNAAYFAERALSMEEGRKTVETEGTRPSSELEKEPREKNAAGAGLAGHEIVLVTDVAIRATSPNLRQVLARIKLVDSNGLALTCFAFSTWLFFAFLCNIDEVGGKNNGVFYMGDMLSWGVSMGLLISGVVQGLNGDHLGFTSYVFHAAILGTIGRNFKLAVSLGAQRMGDMLSWGVSMGLLISGVVQGLNGDHLGFTSYVFHAAILGTIGRNFKLAVSLGPNAAPLHIVGFFCYAAAWFNCIVTVMAFRIAKMFGVLYASVGMMFLLVGLNFEKLLSDAEDPIDKTGDYIAGASCLVVSLQCCYLIFPVMTGRGKIV